ncbi:MAG: DUF4974 domain-containing protein [Pedobacter sp.]|nr:MAG: DUF4974 domain-containing protein [Pedobacter sp.]
MAKKDIFAERQKIEQYAQAWFDRTDDRVPFEAFSDQHEKISTGAEMLDVIRRKIKVQKRYRLWRNVAAAAVVLMIAGIFGYRAYFTAKPSLADPTWVAYIAGKGEFKRIILPDSSIVHLRPGAKLVIAKPFIQKNRQVKLEQGEVYFEVSHDPLHPFLVNAGKITTTVLGTKFIINNDPLFADIKVALLSGKVAVSTANAKLGILSPNQQLSFNRSDETVKLQNSTAYQAENWLKGEYLLEDVSLKSFAKTFGDVFSMKVRFAQKALEDLPISIQFSLTDNPKTILDQLRLIHGIHYQIKDKEVVLMK